jgi:hypothetical protein
MKAANAERELLQHRFQDRHQPGFRDLLRSSHHMPLRHLIHRVDVIQTLDSLPVSLMHGVHTILGRPKMTGMSRAQVARLIRCYQRGEEVKPRVYRRHRFSSRYTRVDVELLAVVDEAHETLSGPATQKILQREWHEFHDARYEGLAWLPVAQLYRLRKSRTYRQRRIVYQPTRPTQVAIGERRRPDPQGQIEPQHSTPCPNV